MRVLGRVRLSRSTEESTSVERQHEIIEAWAKQHDHEIVGWAEDVDVSGSVDPFEAPELGPWLQPERLGEWDVLCAWKMDRLARRTIPLHKLMGFCQDNNKTLVCVADNIDLSTWVGRLVASVVAGVAEGELEAIRERARSSYKKLRSTGRYPGGKLVFGYKAVPLDNGGWTLDVEPAEAEIIRKIIEAVLEGKSSTGIAKELNQAGIPTPDVMRGHKKTADWSSNTIRRLLRNKALLGWSSFEGRTIRDQDGSPILAGPPIVSLEVFNKVQEALDARGSKAGRTRNTSPMLDVLKCWDCGRNLYMNTSRAPYNVRYYGCLDRHYVRIRAEVVEDIVYSLFLDELGDFEQLEKQVVAANDNSAKIAELSQAVADLAELIQDLDSAQAIAGVSKQIKTLDAEIARLESEHNPEAKALWVSTGKTYAQVWEDLDIQGKRELMVKAGISVKARPINNDSKLLEVDFQVPEDLRQRLSG